MDRERRMIAGEALDRDIPGELLMGARSAIQETDTRPAGTGGTQVPTLASDGTTLRSIDPLVADLVARESRRQKEKIILIASESRPHPAVLEALASPFTSLYAEGYPPARLRESPLEALALVESQLVEHERHGNRRYYQGTEFADLIECIAERRTAACFAAGDCPADRIRVNVQPLSGSVANLAVYEALLEPGDTMMAMALTEGGHLTHGSPYSVSGKRYQTVFYGTNPKTGRLDYDAMRNLAKTHQPKLLVGGFTSYPWRPDWAQFREIADEAGAILLADIAHTAGMVIGGVCTNPVGIADVVTFTTHKTLCGPRGAVILSTDRDIARRLDRALFPGMQGGPHVNKMAAIAVAMELARSDRFRRLQHLIVENAQHLADALEDNGLTLAYGGTDTHLLLIDLRPIGLEGEVAARVLDRVGIVCNRNVIPGDRNGGDTHGIRLGTPWVTQRGMGRKEMTDLAGIIARVLAMLASCVEREGGDDFVGGPMGLDLSREAADVRALIARVDPV
ncbi:serine hydroxymethyltransferase [Candidatus Bipolaricaulota bacterium]|nr:serine hydroxymethyltransferase [Candidatus Bipolaricaulota bacterium]